MADKHDGGTTMRLRDWIGDLLGAASLFVLVLIGPYLLAILAALLGA